MLLHKTSYVKDTANVHTKMFAIDSNSFNIVLTMFSCIDCTVTL